MTTLTAKITPEPDENIDDQQIEQEIMDNIHKINFKDKSSFQKSLDSVFDEYEFEQADYDKFWKNPIVQKIYLDIMDIEIQNLENNLNLKRKNVENLQTQLEFKKARKSTYEIDVKYVRSRSVIAHDMSILHLNFCALCNLELESQEDAIKHLYCIDHVNNLHDCFHTGSIPKVEMKTIQCGPCNTKKYQAADLNQALFEHIASFAHAVNGISPPKRLSKQLELTSKANLCAYYVNKNIPANMAQQASGHMTGQAGASMFMNANNKHLNKGEIKYHPLRLTAASHIVNEDSTYKSPAFNTFCMTQGMTFDQVRQMWKQQPIYVPTIHIKGRCGLCKEVVGNTDDKGDYSRLLINNAKFGHVNSSEHKIACKNEWSTIDKRLNMFVPIDTKCFILSYCGLCDEGIYNWNGILNHVLSPNHKKKVGVFLDKRNSEVWALD